MKRQGGGNGRPFQAISHLSARRFAENQHTCTCTHTCTRTPEHTRAHPHTPAHPHTHRQTHMHAHTHIHTHMQAHARAHTHTDPNTHTQTPTEHTHTHAHTHPHTQTHTQTYTNTHHTHIHATNTRAHKLTRSPPAETLGLCVVHLLDDLTECFVGSAYVSCAYDHLETFGGKAAMARALKTRR